MKKFLVVLLLLISNFAIADIPLNEDLSLDEEDISAQDALIEKLETVLPNFSNEKTKSTELKIRLADLYSDRARIKDYQSNLCEKCEDGSKDRKKAVEYYEQSKSAKKSEVLGHVLLQLAHLYKMNDKISKSRATYTDIIKNKSLQKDHLKAHLGLGDIAFQNGSYKTARNEYTIANKTPDIEDQIYTLYRLAWTELNLGNNKKSIEYIQSALKISKQNSKINWQRDLMNDYATIMSHDTFSVKDIETYIQYSDENNRTNNLKFLGQEADRLGNKKGALLIWSQYSEEAKDHKDQAEVQLKLAESLYDLNKYKECLQQLDLVVLSIKKDKCEDCSKVTSDFRGLLVSWSKKEKVQATNALVEAYKKYLSVAENDYEAVVWAAQIARSANNIKQAITYYEQAARLSKSDSKKLEATTSSILELAHEEKNNQIYQQGLLKYLELNPNGEKRYLVRFELAQLDFQNKRFEQSAGQFESLATDSAWNDSKLKFQAAENSLESYSKQNKSAEVFRAAKNYEKLFTNQALHFSEVARKITINNIVTSVAHNQQDAIKDQLRILSSFNTDKLNSKDKSIHYKTQILAAEKINDLATVEQASNHLLSLNTISTSDKELALKSLLWVYELKLNFKKAYAIAQTLPMGDLTKDQRYLKLGLLAELADQNPTTYYEKYVKTAPSVLDANKIRMVMIRTSSNPWKAFDKHVSALYRTPDLLAAMILELHLQKQNWYQIKVVLNNKKLHSTPAGRYIEKLAARENFKSFPSSGSLRSGNNSILKQSIQSRVQYLKSLHKIYKNAQGNISLQLAALDKLANENNKFHKQLLALPIPRGLKPKEKEMYSGMLADQARPFSIAAEKANQTKIQLQDSLSKSLNELFDAIDSGEQIQKQIAINEIKSLKPFLSSGQINSFEDKLKDANVNPNKVNELREEISRNPLDPSPLIALRGLEAKRSNGPLLAYLDQRITQLRMKARR